MYFLGFLFIFIGLVLLAYTLISLFLSKTQQANESFGFKSKAFEKSEKEEPKPQPNESPVKTQTTENTIENHKSKITPTSEESNLLPISEQQAPIQLNPTNKEALSEIPKEPEKPIEKPKEETPQNPLSSSKINLKDLDIFLTGYLYYDPSQSSEIILEKFDKTPTDYLTHLIRLGNCTLEWKEYEFIFNYDEDKIILPIDLIKEIRFGELGAIFLTKKKDIPYYFFLSKQIYELKDFLKKIALTH
ncbi:MAG: hypothetical protein NZ853_10545 [Leptospiraceae bacterium]|nr:hypothetical protein [Leptospiraceae bacterium]MDW7977109.1 hypothetical protein [Leptospiraceae bacterium]